ncbi:MAG: hypothetical protein QY326_09640 [Bdellovibrionota bacterium]|nr:MAG: hypothetical protein QY326_09640 [Bdellovibrionota bacterium]
MTNPAMAIQSSPIANPEAVLEACIAKRALRRQLRVDLPRTRYAVRRIFSTLKDSPAEHALVVGVGHGHDAVMALLDDQVRLLDGVDPYISDDGNDDDDFNELLSLIEATGLQRRMFVHRTTIDEHLSATTQHYDLIVINDVLHHLFLTRSRLESSQLFERAVHLAAALRKVASDDCTLTICDVERHGMRQLLYRMGLMRSWVDFSTKQHWGSWVRAFKESGWQLHSKRNYVPFALRTLEPLLSTPLGSFTACERYIVRMRPAR